MPTTGKRSCPFDDHVAKRQRVTEPKAVQSVDPEIERLKGLLANVLEDIANEGDDEEETTEEPVDQHQEALWDAHIAPLLAPPSPFAVPLTVVPSARTRKPRRRRSATRQSPHAARLAKAQQQRLRNMRAKNTCKRSCPYDDHVAKRQRLISQRPSPLSSFSSRKELKLPPPDQISKLCGDSGRKRKSILRFNEDVKVYFIPHRGDEVNSDAFNDMRAFRANLALNSEAALQDTWKEVFSIQVLPSVREYRKQVPCQNSSDCKPALDSDLSGSSLPPPTPVVPPPQLTSVALDYDTLVTHLPWQKPANVSPMVECVSISTTERRANRRRVAKQRAKRQARRDMLKEKYRNKRKTPPPSAHDEMSPPPPCKKLKLPDIPTTSLPFMVALDFKPSASSSSLYIPVSLTPTAEWRANTRRLAKRRIRYVMFKEKYRNKRKTPSPSAEEIPPQPPCKRRKLSAGCSFYGVTSSDIQPPPLPLDFIIQCPRNCDDASFEAVATDSPQNSDDDDDSIEEADFPQNDDDDSMEAPSDDPHVSFIESLETVSATTFGGSEQLESSSESDNAPSILLETSSVEEVSIPSLPPSFDSNAAGLLVNASLSASNLATGEDDDTLSSVSNSPDDVNDPFPSSQPTTSVEDGMGTRWVSGVRRSSRITPPLGSVYINGLRRSARLR
ncbi:MAG: hypothetical protein SGILL_005698 [Bacillariaceae sp.]